MVARVHTSALLGMEARSVLVEVDVADGLPGVQIVGSPDQAVRESRDRVLAAIRNSGYAVPSRRVTVNLAPADVPKEGSLFDLAIALAILAASEQLGTSIPEEFAVLGELALDGTVRPVEGTLPVAMVARKVGRQVLIVPRDNAPEAALVDGLTVFAVESLAEAIRIVRNPDETEPVRVDREALLTNPPEPLPDLADVVGQEAARRALEVAAAGGHHLLMLGPPGSGKTMLARRLPSILPPLSLEEALEVSAIHSVLGALPPEQPLIVSPPFRDPHHTTSAAGLLGGGRLPRPGEISMAHRGVLFLDEFPEFRRDVLEALRQPLESGTVTVTRAQYTATFPAQVMLVAAMNPCPCGYYGDTHRRCRCTLAAIERYLRKVSGPVLDRIDIHIQVPAVPFHQLTERRPGEPSGPVRERVLAARAVQRERFAGTSIRCNGQMGPAEVREFCTLDSDAQELLNAAMKQLLLSARGYDRILKVARTIADLDGEPTIQARHVAEAVQYRSLDRMLTG